MVGLLSQRIVQSEAAACCGQACWEESVANGDPEGFLQFLASVVVDKTIMVHLRKNKREKQFSETKMLLLELHLIGFYSF